MQINDLNTGHFIEIIKIDINNNRIVYQEYETKIYDTEGNCVKEILFGEVKFDTRTPKIFRGTNIVVNTTGNNITKVEIYIDNVLKHTSPKPSFEWCWNVDVEKGIHEIKAVAYNSMGFISRDIKDVYTFK